MTLGGGPSRAFDVGRILHGELPWSFLVEAAIRTIVLYALLVVSMRLMGKRMASSISRNELAALVSLAAAVGPAMEGPDRGLLPPFLIAGVIIGAQRLIALGTFRSARFEQRAVGDVTTLVRDGELDVAAMQAVGLSRERIFAQLRSLDVDNLGRVQRLYLETNGAFTLVKFDGARPGLSVLPAWDGDLFSEQAKVDGKVACASCGHVDGDGAGRGAHRCARCGEVKWRPAVAT